MLKVLGLVLTTVLLLGIASCASADRTTNAPAAAPATATASSTPTATTAPTSPTPSSGPTTASVKGSNFKWVDDASGTRITTIKVGGTVTWTVTQGTHSLERVAASATNGCDELDDSFNADLDQPVTRTFTKAGTFGYHCGIHKGNPNCKTPGSSSGMSGIIKVVP